MTTEFPVPSSQFPVAPSSPPQLRTENAQLTTPPPVSLSPRAAILHKLLERLESGYQKSIRPQDAVDSLRNSVYTIIVVATHFGFPNHVAQDLVMTSATIADLAAKIADLKGLPAEQLFT